MALSTQQIADAWKRWVGTLDQATPCQFSKTDLQAAVTAVDSWCTSNAASYNSALPTAFRNSATAGQKAALLAIVALSRYGGGI